MNTQKTRSHYVIVCLFLVLFIFLSTAFSAAAQTCSDIFPTALSSSASTGQVQFELNSALNLTDGTIDISIASDATNNGNPSCVSQRCVDSSNRAQALTLPLFEQSSSSQDHTINNGQTLSLVQGSYDQIQLNYQATVRFTQNSEVTFIQNLNSNNSETTLIFEEGVYWIDNFDIGYQTQIVINGSDKVTLIINSSNFNQSEVVFNANGTPDQLALITYGSVHFGYRSSFKGFVYANDSVILENESAFEGAINGDDILLKFRSAVTYAPDSADGVDFGGICDSTLNSSSLSGNLHVDNAFEAYISTDDSIQGTFLSSGTNWPTPYSLTSSLSAGQDYYLHIRATDTGGAAAFLGDFEITGSGHTFSNGLNTLSTNAVDWSVSTSGWSNYQLVSDYGQNGVGPWGTRSSIDSSARWIWSSNNNDDNLNYFSTRIIAQNICEDTGTLNAVGIRISNANGATNTQINNTTEALQIHAAWLLDGSPSSGLITATAYNVAASGASDVDRIDFGGSGRTFSPTLPYPGFADGVSGSDFLVHTSGTLSLPAGTYTIYVTSDDGFSFVMDTVSGDTVSFNKFGRSTAGQNNELRFENPTGNSQTGGTFTLSQDSVFDIAAIFFERGGGDFLEIMIANTDTNQSRSASNYVILADGALGGQVNFGSCPEPDPEPVPLAEYRFEENAWDGSTDEILDSTGNDYHGQVTNNSSRETASPALTGNPGTCGYASQNDGSIQVTGLPLDTATLGVKTTVTFWMNWDGTDNAMPIGWNVHDIWMYRGDIGFNTGASDIYGISSAGLANTWHHVAVEFTNGSVTSNRIHINGVEQVLTQRRGSPNNNNAFVRSEMRIGGWSVSRGYDFHGLMDEVRIYEGALSTAEIADIMAQRHPCNITEVHHYEIIHDGQGLTCDAETITIRACADASCSSLSPDIVSLDVLADSTVIGSPTFTGSTSITFNNTDVETLTLSVNNASVVASNPLVCDDGSGSSCNIAFSDAGFRFLYGSGNSTTVADQTAGLSFADELKLQAVQNVDGVCTGLFTGNTSVNLSQENVAPGGITGLTFDVNSVPIAKHTSTSAVTLSFGADSIASIPSPVYNDAGQIRLHANYNIGGVSLIGSSNPFWVSPAELLIEVSAGANAIDGANANSGSIYPAGESFTFTVSAYNGASTALITPNYSPGQIQLLLTRTGPTLSDSVDGVLTYAAGASLSSSVSPTFQNVSLNSFSSGISTYNAANYSEVGLINIDAQDSDYGSVGIVVAASDRNVGRFTPHYFTQTIVEDGVFVATCSTNTAFIAYSGQMDEASNSIGAISYLTNPILAITAYNEQGQITRNYYQDSQGSANDYMKLSATDISISLPNADQAALGVDSSNLPVTSNMSTGVLSSNDLSALPSSVALPRGVLHYQFSNSDNFVYLRSDNALVAPFTSDIDFSVSSIFDADTVGLNSTVNASPTGLEIRFGRLFIENSFGPETSNFPQAMQIEHFNGTDFIASSDDNCLSYDASNMSLTNISLDPAVTSVLGGTGSFLSSRTQAIELAAPGAGNQGQIGVSYDVYDWLKYDWDNDGAFDNNPSAVATFGLFRGNDRTIHWREIFNE